MVVQQTSLEEVREPPEEAKEASKFQVTDLTQHMDSSSDIAASPMKLKRDPSKEAPQNSTPQQPLLTKSPSQLLDSAVAVDKLRQLGQLKDFQSVELQAFKDQQDA